MKRTGRRRPKGARKRAATPQGAPAAVPDPAWLKLMEQQRAGRSSTGALRVPSTAPYGREEGGAPSRFKPLGWEYLCDVLCKEMGYEPGTLAAATASSPFIRCKREPLREGTRRCWVCPYWADHPEEERGTYAIQH